MKVVALVGEGRHPASGRVRRAPMDARALELGLSLPNAELQVIHAGMTDSIALPEYLGMGIQEVSVIEQKELVDAAPALIEALILNDFDIILMGECSEGGEGSGMLPYLIAHALGLPVLPNIVEVSGETTSELRVIQALPRGQRRALSCNAPCLITVNMAAPAPRQSAYGLARKGKIKVLNSEQAPLLSPFTLPEWQSEPARKRPKRLKIVKAKTAAERFKAATAIQSAGGKVVHPSSPEDAAAIILDYLRKAGLVDKI